MPLAQSGLLELCTIVPLARPLLFNRLLESASPEPVKASPAAKQTIRSLLALQAVVTEWPPLAKTEHWPWLECAVLPCMLSSK